MSWPLLLFLLCTIYQLICWLGIFKAVPWQETKSASERRSTYPPVSIIICFRNEAARLEQYLPTVLAQDYPHFEVVAVDDYSSDASAIIVSNLSKHHQQLRLVKPPQETRVGKKDALAYGIAQAKYDLFLLTDADCEPASTQWLAQMVTPFVQPETLLVLGCSPYLATKGWLNRFQRFETYYTALQYLGLAKVGMPYMGVGRNVAYRRSFFAAAAGFTKHAHLPGGDDDLLISHQATAATTDWVTAPLAWTWSDPALNLREYLQRKTRHLSVGAHYPWRPKLFLGLLAASHLGLYLLAMIVWCCCGHTLLVASVLLFRWVVLFRVYNQQPAFWSKEGKRSGIPFHVVLQNDFYLSLYYLILSPAPLLGKFARGGWQ